MAAYCTVAELATLGISSEAYREKSATERATQIASTSDFIDSFLASRYTLPLTVYPNIIKECCAKLASCDLIDSIGRDPDADDIVDVTRKYWTDWLKMVAAGTVTPPGVEDSSPGGSSAITGGARVQSASSRGYGARGTGIERGPFQTD